MTKIEAVTLLNIIGEDGRKQRPGVAAKQQPTEPSTTKRDAKTAIHRDSREKMAGKQEVYKGFVKSSKSFEVLISLGDFPNSSLKHTLRYEGLPKPV